MWQCVRRKDFQRMVWLLMLGSLFSGCSQNAQVGNPPRPEDYKRLLAINQVQSYYYTEPKTKVRYPQIRGTLTNLGGETLIVVEFTLRFRDNLNQVIHEEHAYPVFVSRFSVNAANPALGPGQKIPFAFKAPDCPSNWQAGRVDIEVTKVVFANSSQG